MARTTNSDTLNRMSSRYELGMLATQRVRDLNGGSETIIPANDDKPTVVALREIATGNIDIEKLRHEFIQSYKVAGTTDDSESAIESKSEDPILKELDAELEDAIIEEIPTAEEAEINEEILDEADVVTE
jgi:DNA-directed RNA polymerase subunit omega